MIAKQSGLWREVAPSAEVDLKEFVISIYIARKVSYDSYLCKFIKIAKQTKPTHRSESVLLFITNQVKCILLLSIHQYRGDRLLARDHFV